MPVFVELDPLDGRCYPAIERAVHVAREKGLKIEDYTLRVFRDGNGITVLFSSCETSAAIKGSAGKPGFEVELDGNLRVLRSNFVR